MDIKISAIICAFNRANYLRKAIQSLVEQSLDTSFYEILVVDNRSTDNTQQVATEEFAHVANLRYIYEPIQGLPQARNTGWRNARGMYVAYLDDDAIASPQWLEKVLEVFETVTPQPGCVGGKIEAIWEAPRPVWLSDKLLPWLTVIDLHNRPLFLEENQFIVGANMAFSQKILQELSGFKEDFNSMFYNEELWMQKQLRKVGYRCFYDPNVKVGHHISGSRLRQKYLIKRHYRQGIADAFLYLDQVSTSKKTRLRLAWKATQEILRDWREILFWIFNTSTQDPEIFLKQLDKYCKIGYIVGLINRIFY